MNSRISYLQFYREHVYDEQKGESSNFIMLERQNYQEINLITFNAGMEQIFGWYGNLLFYILFRRSRHNTQQ